MLARSRLMPLELRHGNEMIGAQGTSRGESRGGGWWSEHNRQWEVPSGSFRSSTLGAGEAQRRGRAETSFWLRLPFLDFSGGTTL